MRFSVFSKMRLPKSVTQVRRFNPVVRRAISFCNKNYNFLVGENLVERFKCRAMDVLNVNYFIFSFVSMNCEIVLNFWTYVLV